MNSFELASQVEKAGLADLLPYIAEYHPDVQLVMTGNQMFVQKWLGDFLWRRAGRQHVYAVELKVEAKTSSNLYLESHSNFGDTLGWLWTSQADWLWYYFLESKELYHADMRALKRWAFGNGPDDAHLLNYPEKSQRKHKQPNHTRGFCVPIAVLKQAINLRGPGGPANPPTGGAGDEYEWFKKRTPPTANGPC